MGFLDHSTNNIIIDAVLTNLGREILASNAGAFQVSKFSLGDDEVDYTLIRKFGRTIGKEKIIKNTPIFEAQTAQDIALKNRLITVINPTATHLPVISTNATLYAEGQSIPGVANYSQKSQVKEVSISAGTNSYVILQANQTMGGVGGSVPAGMSDQQYDVFSNNKFISLYSSTGQGSGNLGSIKTYSSLDPLTSIARYVCDTSNGSLNIGIRSVNSLQESAFQVYGSNGVIKTMLTLVGRTSGMSTSIVVNIIKAQALQVK